MRFDLVSRAPIIKDHQDSSKNLVFIQVIPLGRVKKEQLVRFKI